MEDESKSNVDFMTIIITISCRDGILVAADRKISSEDGNSSSEKIISNGKLSCSYWGWKTYSNNFGKMIEFDKFLRRILKENSDIGQVANEIHEFLSNNEVNEKKDKKGIGVHLAGFIDNDPYVFHIFWCSRYKKFISECYNEEYHDINCVRHKRNEYLEHFIIFNGVGDLVKLIEERPHLFKERRKDYSTICFDEALKTAKKYIFQTSDVGSRFCGMGMNYLKITKEGISGIEIISQEELKKEFENSTIPQKNVLRNEWVKVIDTVDYDTNPPSGIIPSGIK